MSTEIKKSEQERREQLTSNQYHGMRAKGTERPFTGAYVDAEQDGVYRCAGCGAELFDSNAKFDSGTGWPSFCEPANRANVHLDVDTSYGMTRTEVSCAACGGHLGHVFDDGPASTGKLDCTQRLWLRYLIADLEGDSDRMRRVGHLLDELRRRPV